MTNGRYLLVGRVIFRRPVTMWCSDCNGVTEWHPVTRRDD